MCIRLGFWQLDRREERRERNAIQAAALDLPPLRLEGDSLAAVLRDPAGYRYRRVVLRGAFLPDADVVLRGRARDGRPGVELLTPFRLRSGRVVLVNRGWAPSPDAASVDPAPLFEPGPRTIQALLQPITRVEAETRPVTLESTSGTTLSVQRVDLGELSDSLDLPLLPVLLHQLAGPADPPLPARLPLPETASDGPHLGYAVQWFGFAAIALGGVALVYLRGRRR